jgi:CheY-like chemotaxis protein
MNDRAMLLLVEDEPVIALTLETVLDDAGFAVLTAGSGAEAIPLLDERVGDIVGVITDIRLVGDMTGWDVARHARTLKPDIAVVYMSGDSAADWSSEGVPMSVMLSKPFADAQLITAISTLLNQSG